MASEHATDPVEQQEQAQGQEKEVVPAASSDPLIPAKEFESEENKEWKDDPPIPSSPTLRPPITVPEIELSELDTIKVLDGVPDDAPTLREHVGYYRKSVQNLNEKNEEANSKLQVAATAISQVNDSNLRVWEWGSSVWRKYRTTLDELDVKTHEWIEKNYEAEEWRQERDDLDHKLNVAVEAWKDRNKALEDSKRFLLTTTTNLKIAEDEVQRLSRRLKKKKEELEAVRREANKNISKRDEDIKILNMQLQAHADAYAEQTEEVGVVQRSTQIECKAPTKIKIVPENEQSRKIEELKEEREGWEDKIQHLQHELQKMTDIQGSTTKTLCRENEVLREEKGKQETVMSLLLEKDSACDTAAGRMCADVVQIKDSLRRMTEDLREQLSGLTASLPDIATPESSSSASDKGAGERAVGRRPEHRSEEFVKDENKCESGGW